MEINHPVGDANSLRGTYMYDRPTVYALAN